MGYDTDFEGQLNINPPLNEKEITYLNAFSNSRRMHRERGPYFVGEQENSGQNHTADIINYNRPDPSQPSLWCQWVPTDDGMAIEWDGGEKFYEADKWLQYIIDHFIGKNPIAKRENRHFDFLQGHTVGGVIHAQGEESDDTWRMIVTNDIVKVQDGTVMYLDDPTPVEVIGLDFTKAIEKM